MCLRSETYTQTEATEAIPVYKVLLRNGCGMLLTPYRNALIPKIPYMQKAEGPQRITEGASENKKLYPHFIGNDYYVITEGFIHAYTNKKAAMIETASWNMPCVIVKGYVPKGALYFMGMDHDICATRIKLECIIFEDSEWKNNYCTIEEFSWPYCKTYRGTCRIYFFRFKTMLKQLFCKHK